jgi:hypothetical protein
MSDRTVHARLHSGDEIVRYDRGGKRYHEWPTPRDGKWRNALTLTRAVTLCTRQSATWFEGRPGGRIFDARLHAARAAPVPAEPER